jgi:hypothetical protein
MTDHGSSGVSFSDEALHGDNSECGREGTGRDLVLGKKMLTKCVAKTVYAP